MAEVLALVMYCFLMSVTPGPNNVMLAMCGANFGYRRTLPYLLGCIAGVFVMTVFVCAGLGATFLRFPSVHTALKVLGAVYLAYLAWRLAFAKPPKAQERSRPLSFLDGALFQFLNPKSWMKATTIATLFMPAEWGVTVGAFWVATVGVLVAFPSISLWALFGVAIGNLLKDPRRLGIFNGLMGASLLALAVGLLF